MIITVVTPETCVFFFSLKPLVGPKVSTERTDNNRRVVISSEEQDLDRTSLFSSFNGSKR